MHIISQCNTHIFYQNYDNHVLHAKLYLVKNFLARFMSRTENFSLTFTFPPDFSLTVFKFPWLFQVFQICQASGHHEPSWWQTHRQWSSHAICYSNGTDKKTDLTDSKRQSARTVALTSDDSTPLRHANSWRWSAHVSWGDMMLDCGQTPSIDLTPTTSRGSDTSCRPAADTVVEDSYITIPKQTTSRQSQHQDNQGKTNHKITLWSRQQILPSQD